MANQSCGLVSRLEELVIVVLSLAVYAGIYVTSTCIATADRMVRLWK
jgi:hypothetical protein